MSEAAITQAACEAAPLGCVYRSEGDLWTDGPINLSKFVRFLARQPYIEQTPAGTIDWKMEALRTARLLADAQRIIAEYKAQAIEAARGPAQTPNIWTEGGKDDQRGQD